MQPNEQDRRRAIELAARMRAERLFSSSGYSSVERENLAADFIATALAEARAEKVVGSSTSRDQESEWLMTLRRTCGEPGAPIQIPHNFHWNVVERIITAEQNGVARGQSDVAARSAEVARKWTDEWSRHDVGSHDLEDCAMCAAAYEANAIADAILALSPDPNYRATLRDEIAEKVAAVPVTQPYPEDWQLVELDGSPTEHLRPVAEYRNDVLAILRGEKE